MQKLSAELQQKAWTAAALMGALAAAGAILMWKAEEKQTPAAATAPRDANDAALAPRPAFRPAA